MHASAPLRAVSAANLVVSTPFKRAQLGLFHGRLKQAGNNVPFSKKKTRRTWLPNVQNKRFVSDLLDRKVRIKATTKAIKTMKKLGGFDAYLLHTTPTLLGARGMQLRLAMLDNQWDARTASLSSSSTPIPAPYALPPDKGLPTDTDALAARVRALDPFDHAAAAHARHPRAGALLPGRNSHLPLGKRKSRMLEPKPTRAQATPSAASASGADAIPEGTPLPSLPLPPFEQLVDAELDAERAARGAMLIRAAKRTDDRAQSIRENATAGAAATATAAAAAAAAAAEGDGGIGDVARRWLTLRWLRTKGSGKGKWKVVKGERAKAKGRKIAV